MHEGIQIIQISVFQLMCRVTEVQVNTDEKDIYIYISEIDYTRNVQLVNDAYVLCELYVFNTMCRLSHSRTLNFNSYLIGR